MRKLIHFFRKNRFGVLLASLLLLLLLAPHFKEGRLGRVMLSLLGTLAILSAILAAARNRRELWLALTLGSVALTGVWLFYGVDTVPANVIHDLATTVFYLYIAFMILRHVLSREEDADGVDADTLFAAVCVYLLLGIGWADAYHAMENAHPGSFVLSALVEEPAPADRSVLIYYSFVTLTTLGYGDVLPTHAAARSLAMVEAIVGVIYLAVIISRIAGLYRFRSGRNSSGL